MKLQNLNIRVSEEEKKILIKLAKENHLSLSSYVRYKSLNN
jgi:uncharacterized protein (DUF1778 family)